ncbi:xyloside transporter XynT [Lachnospiraceae bacterium KM106-2]|nr:xyloside transporter XynT [Lachnospiraceae bacterium KM106-2]
MEEKKYLKNYQILTYGLGDFGSNFVYCFVSSFCLIFMTDAIGLNAGILGTLIMLSKLLDGVSDFIFGSLIDRTKTKMGKAKPWMLWSTFPLAISQIALFFIPDLGSSFQYVYFFVVYSLLNAGFYTANNIAYSALTALITKNSVERVKMGVSRAVFATLGAIGVSSIAAGLVTSFGGGVHGWRMVAIIFSLVMTVTEVICVLTQKEIPEETKRQVGNEENVEKGSFIHNFKILLHNKYYLLVLAYYLVFYFGSGVTSSAGAYYCTYVLGNANLLGLLSMIGSIPMVIGAMLTPTFINRYGMHKTISISMLLSTLSCIPMVFGGFQGAFTVMLVAMALKAVFNGPISSALNAIIAEAANYSLLKDGVHLEGTMYSCSSMGVKIGNGFGIAACGWLLELSRYSGSATVQTAGAITMLKVLYVLIPAIATAILTIIIYKMDVFEVNEKLRKEKGVKEV